jgi:hypothetical protein
MAYILIAEYDGSINDCVTSLGHTGGVSALLR